jgi:hypothetical protein
MGSRSADFLGHQLIETINLSRQGEVAMLVAIQDANCEFWGVVSTTCRVARRRFLLPVFSSLCLFLGVVGLGYAADAPQQDVHGATEPLMLDLAKFFYEPNLKLDGKFEALMGRHVFDGLPFEIGGQVRVYGKTPCSRGQKLQDAQKGIRIGRTFDELYLVHHTTWPDADGQKVAFICLNYDDGTDYVFSIRYGVHVRDWYNLPSYEKEVVSDPNTTICWRNPPVQYKAPLRIFKTKVVNPFPKKVVDTMDIVSAHNLGAYNLLAATVVNRDSAEAGNVTGDRSFDGKLNIQVVDDATGEAIEGALVEPCMQVCDEGVVGEPFYTSSAGKGTISFPTNDTASISASVKKAGYSPAGHSWQPPIKGDFTFRLSPANASTAKEP